MIGYFFIGLSLLGLAFLLLMLYLQRQQTIETSEGEVPYKLTPFEKQKAIDGDYSVTSVPIASNEERELPAMYADKNDVPPAHW